MKTPPRELDSRALLVGLAAGQERAFEALYDLHGARLYRTALALSRDKEEAEDAVQEVFLGVVRARTRLVHVRNLTSYLFTALRHAISRGAARTSREAAALEALASTAPSASWSAPDSWHDDRGRTLDAALRALPPEQHEVIRLKLDGGLTFAEIGDVLDVSAHTAASRYRYALEKLRARLEGAV